MPYDAYVGDIMIAGFNFAPVNFLPCDGRLVDTAVYEELFNVIGTTYGGDGTHTFALPDLRGRLPIGAGNGPLLTPRVVGEAIGVESVALNSVQLPSHSHTLKCVRTGADSPNPEQRVPAIAEEGVYPYGVSSSDVSSIAEAVLPQGSGLAHPNMQPSLCVGFYICHTGIFPPLP